MMEIYQALCNNCGAVVTVLLEVGNMPPRPYFCSRCIREHKSTIGRREYNLFEADIVEYDYYHAYRAGETALSREGLEEVNMFGGWKKDWRKRPYNSPRRFSLNWDVLEYGEPVTYAVHDFKFRLIPVDEANLHSSGLSEISGGI